MISFFRKIRRKLLIESKFSQYLIYAFGEILLIVLGILIALSINNWNDNRNKKQKEVFYLNEIRNSLQKNLDDEVLPAIEDYENAIESYSILQSNFYESSGELSQDSLKSLIYNVSVNWELLLNTVAFENLKSIGIDLISNDSLRGQITDLYGFDIVNLISQEERSQKFFSEQMQPAHNSEIGSWTNKDIKSEIEIESIRKNAYFASKLNSRTYLTKLKLYWLKLSLPQIEQLITNIESEVERLELRK